MRGVPGFSSRPGLINIALLAERNRYALLTAYCLLLTAYCLLLTAFCLLPFASYGPHSLLLRVTTGLNLN